LGYYLTGHSYVNRWSIPQNWWT